MTRNTLGNVIRDIRKSKNLTQKDLSNLTGFSQNTISNHENMKRSLDELDIYVYAKALNVTPQYLFECSSNAKNKTMSELSNKEIMAKNIKYYMDKYGVDRKKLSNDLDIKYTTLTDWLKTNTYPRIDKIELLANYFNISKSDLVENASLDISSVYNQLNEQRQKIVYRFAEDQLIEQKKGQSDLIDNLNNENNNIYTLAAHSDDPDKNYTDEEIRAIQSELAKIKQAHEAKKKKK